jgi:hypothetical protein
MFHWSTLPLTSDYHENIIGLRIKPQARYATLPNEETKMTGRKSAWVIMETQERNGC